MTRISMKALAEEEPERWRKIMADPLAKNGRDLDWDGAGPLRTPRQRHAAFEALGRPPTPEECRAISPLFTTCKCTSCGATDVDLMEFCDDSDDPEYSYATVCAACLRRALDEMAL